MDNDLHLKYEKVKFSDEILDMFIDILEEDQPVIRVLYYIAQELKDKEKPSSEQDGTINGVTINNIVENVKIERLVRHNKGKSYKYETEITHIHRKTAERIIDKLLSMSLLYYKPVKPYKIIYLTYRGKQILKRLYERKKETINKKEMHENG